MRTHKTLVPVLGLFAMVLVGCATMADAENSVRGRAAFDLGCQDLQITDLPGRAYGVEGCGMRAVYVYASPDCGAPTQHGRKEFADACTPILDHIVHAHGKGEACPHCKGMHGKGEHKKMEHGKMEHGHHRGQPDADAPKAEPDEAEAPTARDPDSVPDAAGAGESGEKNK